MTNTNGFSDSQESALLGEEEYHELEKEIGATFPLLTDDVIDEFPEEKYDVQQTEQYLYEGERTREEDPNVYNGKRMRNEEQYLDDAKQTMETEQAPYYQELETPVPIKEEFPGHLNFQLLLNNQGSSKHWVYSQTLKKVFINMEQTLPLRFKWEPPLDGLYLRTVMVFSLDQYRSDPVRRCHNHMAPSNRSNQNIDPRLMKHVVRCLDRSSMYEERNQHLSIVTPLRTPQPGSQYVPMCFQFLCKNSCPSGMNRRPTELIFTLEDHRNNVLGRRRLLVRVCSCPKRDKEKEEAEVEDPIPGAKKRKVAGSNGKKVLLPSCDTHVFNVQLNIVGKENYLSVLKYAYDIMAGQAARSGQFDFFKPYMDDILRKTP